jgi:class 3 adenylate cyclase
VAEPSPRKLAVILHADVVGSTALVRINETLAHERIQDLFQRFSKTIDSYGGVAHELRGDALVAEFERTSDAVSAALAFQTENPEVKTTLDDDMRPQLRIGISMGEVVIADNTITGEGVVLAQRVEQLANPGGVCITSAIHEALPKRMPFDLENLGEQTLKGFDDSIRVYRVELSPDKSIPLPQETHQSVTSQKTKSRIIAVAVVILVVVATATYWVTSKQPEETPWTTQFPVDSGSRGFSRAGVKMGRINLRLDIPTRWDARIIEEKDLNLQGFESSVEQVQWDFARLLDGTMNSLALIATDREEVAHFRVFKLYKYIPAHTDEAAIKWMQDRGVQLVIDRYTGTTNYEETRGPIEKGALGSGEKMTMVPSVLRINEEKRYVWTVFTLRPNSSNALYEYIVFFFHNESDARPIHKNLLLEITNYATKMFK